MYAVTISSPEGNDSLVIRWRTAQELEGCLETLREYVGDDEHWFDILAFVELTECLRCNYPVHYNAICSQASPPR